MIDGIDKRDAVAGQAGIYVHFAYCACRCAYCDFALATPRHMPAALYTDALIAELKATAAALPGPARTLYVGGGTPSLWPTADLGRFLEAVRAFPGIAPAAEITLEANPEQISPRWLGEVLSLGVNRISLGVQSLDPAELLALTRAHGVSGATAALGLLAEAYAHHDLTTFSVDLMYGLAGQSLTAFITRLGELVDRFAPPHLSLYALTVDPATVLGLSIRRGRAPAPDPALQGDMLFAARDLLAARGYTHYEVSSWAQPGHIARHNSAYWELRPWLGLGAGAHGFLAGRRSRNEPRPSRYIERIRDTGSAVAEVELPDEATLAFERILTGLRRLDLGLTLTDPRFDAAVLAEVEAGRLVRQGDVIRLTDLGLRFMDDVLLALLP